MIQQANSIAAARLIEQYTEGQIGVWTIAGTCVTARSAAKRAGVPADALSFRYVVEHPNQGWSFSVRAVWRTGSLFEPTAVHTTIENYYDEGVGSEEAAQAAINDWLCSLPL